MEATPSPQAILAEVSAAARRIGMAKRTFADVAAMAIMGADEKMSLGEARRIVANHLAGAAA